MAREVTVRGRLVAQRTDWAGYTAYVFENLEAKTQDEKYLMCTQFPNWDQSYISQGDVGFVTVRYVNAGVDTWFDGTQYVPYKNTDVHFLKFVPFMDIPDDVELTL